MVEIGQLLRGGRLGAPSDVLDHRLVLAVGGHHHFRSLRADGDQFIAVTVRGHDSRSNSVVRPWQLSKMYLRRNNTGLVSHSEEIRTGKKQA